MKNIISKELKIPVGNFQIFAQLTIPQDANGIVVFSHGSGSSRHSPRNKFVAEELNKKRIATLLVDLLTRKEDEQYMTKFDINLLTERLIGVTNWILQQENLKNFKIGYFGASTGAASAINAAGHFGKKISSFVSRGGRTDLATISLSKVTAPALFIVGSLDTQVIEMNKNTFKQLTCEKEMVIVEDASHLFEEIGKLEGMTDIAVHWFQDHLCDHHVEV